jgi:menaquinol-cytochrome c reductase cytochrome b subunit
MTPEGGSTEGTARPTGVALTHHVAGSTVLFKEFLKHVFPRVVPANNLKFTYTFCLGGLAFGAFMLLAGSGLLLLLYYQPSPETAYHSILFIESSVWGGRYLRGLHRLTSHCFLILIVLHTLRVIFTGAYRKPRELNWIIGSALLGLSLFAAYTGYLLPMDQLALWAAQTGMELLNSAFFGGTALRILVPDGVSQSMSLLRFYVLHIILLPLSLLLLSFLHFYRVRKDKGVLPYL